MNIIKPYQTFHTLQKRIKPQVIKKVPAPSGGLQWDEKVTQLVLKLLSHRTPPSCIGANILTIAKVIFPTLNIVEELPSVRFIRGTRSTLAYITKLLAAHNLGHAELYKEHHSDGTGRRQVQLQNCIIRIPTADGYKTITLSSAILSVDETSEEITELSYVPSGKGEQ